MAATFNAELMNAAGDNSILLFDQPLGPDGKPPSTITDEHGTFELDSPYPDAEGRYGYKRITPENE